MVDELTPGENIRRTVEQLCEGEPRRSTGESESDAENLVADQLNELGFSVDRDEFKVPSGQPPVIAAHLALVLLAVILARFTPLVALALSVFATISLFGELTCRFFWFGRLLKFARSSNVLGVKTCDNPTKKIVIVGRLDAPIDISRLSFLGRTMTADSPIAFSLAATMTCVFLIRSFGGWGVPLAIVEGVLTLVIVALAAVAARVHWQGSTTSGAVNGAGGVGVLLEVAREIARRDPQGIEFWLLCTGASEVNLAGMRHFFKSLFYRLDHYSTYLINLPSAGAGQLHYVTGEQRLTPIFYPPDLVYLSGRIVKDRNIENILPVAYKDFTDAAIGARLGYRSVSLVALDESNKPIFRGSSEDTPEQISTQSCAASYEFVMSLIDRIADE
jgi:hypothetical protein